jgi:BirA family biotin operon repressor/biotin-[acetyl-CoA-carboxylase] ligase
MSLPTLVSRLERFEHVSSTQDLVRGWLADGVPEVCVATADIQTAGRGRLERRWQAGTRQALMLSAGFRPTDLPMERAWRMPAVVALSMLEAATAVLAAAAAGPSAMALKWPNDLVAVHDGRVRKLGGVLVETVADGDRLASAIVGIGVNVDWPATDFPPDLADSMWSLRELAASPVDREVLLGAWLERLAERYAALQSGQFDTAEWAGAQVTTGADLEIDLGTGRVVGRGVGFDPESGALLLRDRDGRRRSVAFGEVVRCRVGGVGRVRADL